MLDRSLLLAIPMALATVANAAAASLDALQGAWTMDLTTCADTFETVNGKVRFKERSASTSTGIIVSGDKIVGPNATCTAKRVHQEKDRLTVSLSCTDAVMFSEMSVSFRMIDANSFERFDPVFSDVLTTYHKCSL